LPTDTGLCFYGGDPHYKSFDGRRFDYQGVCKHLLVGLLPGQAAGDLLSFQVFGRNEYRNGYTAVAWFHDVEIVYSNESIQLTRGASLSDSAIATVKTTFGDQMLIIRSRHVCLFDYKVPIPDSRMHRLRYCYGFSSTLVSNT
jgi:von Willebrand factor type D domain